MADLTGKLRALQPDVVADVQSYYETEAPLLVSADRHTLLLPVAMKKLARRGPEERAGAADGAVVGHRGRGSERSSSAPRA